MKLSGFSILAERKNCYSKGNHCLAIERAWQSLKQNKWAMQALQKFVSFLGSFVFL